MSTIERVSVVIVAHNTRAYIEQRLEALSVTSHELIVVDNASNDGTVDVVRARFPEVRLIELAENRGFGAASNEGCVSRPARTSCFSTQTHGRLDGIERLVECASRNARRLGAAGPVLLDGAKHHQVSAFGFPTRRWTELRPSRPPGRRQRSIVCFAWPPRRQRASWRGGAQVFLVRAVLLLRREAVEDVGGFDPDFFMFNEDVDLCWRLWERGWTVEQCPEARFVHVGEGSTGGDWTPLYREQVRGHLRFLMKHHGSSEADAAREHLVRVLRTRALAAGSRPGRLPANGRMALLR